MGHHNPRGVANILAANDLGTGNVIIRVTPSKDAL
jgi:hypothetical protein